VAGYAAAAMVFSTDDSRDDEDKTRTRVTDALSRCSFVFFLLSRPILRCVVDDPLFPLLFPAAALHERCMCHALPTGVATARRLDCRLGNNPRKALPARRVMLDQ
jgi:hypothetical protein